MFEQVNQELTEDNRRLEEQNRQPEQLTQDLEYLRALEEDNLRLSREKRQLEENLQQSITIQNCQEARGQSIGYHLSTIQQEATQINNYVSFLDKNNNSVHELLLEVKQQYGDILWIWEDAWESARALEFKPFKQVYIAFEVLAETGRNYFNRRAVGESMGADFWKKAFQDRGLSNVYRSGEHEQTMNRYGGARIFTHQGESRQMTQHLTLKLGNAQATPCVQIYFYINRDERRVDIGYCGKHLPTVSRSS